MFSQVQVANFGLAKIGSSLVSRLNPPQSSLERFVAAGFDHWRRSEIAKRRWVFATDDYFALTQVEVFEGRDQPYKYDMPQEVLRPIRTKFTEWKQRGRFIYSAHDTLSISAVLDVDTAEFDPLFVDVLAARVAVESAEYITQSNSKKAEAAAMYDDAVASAGKANAFTIGPEDVSSDDNDFPFLTSRY